MLHSDLLLWVFFRTSSTPMYPATIAWDLTCTTRTPKISQKFPRKHQGIGHKWFHLRVSSEPPQQLCFPQKIVGNQSCSCEPPNPPEIRDCDRSIKFHPLGIALSRATSQQICAPGPRRNKSNQRRGLGLRSRAGLTFAGSVAAGEPLPSGKGVAAGGRREM
jgi:hypothetical protein